MFEFNFALNEKKNNKDYALRKTEVFATHGCVAESTVMCDNRTFSTHKLSVSMYRYVFANKGFYPHLYIRVGETIKFYLHIFISKSVSYVWDQLI